MGAARWLAIVQGRAGALFPEVTRLRDIVRVSDEHLVNIK